MKPKNKLLLGLGISLLPISFMAVAVSCSAPVLTKEDATKEAAKVTLDIADKVNKLPSEISKTSTFVQDKFDKEKYELKVQSVEVGTDRKSIVVTFRLKVKNTDVESEDKKLTITGFKEEQASTPKTEDKKPEDKPKPGDKDGASGADVTIPKDKDKEKSETKPEDKPKPDTEPTTPEIQKILTELKTHLTQKLSDLIDKNKTTISNGSTLISKIKEEFAKTNPQVTFEVKEWALKIGNETVQFKPFSSAVTDGLSHMFKTNGGDIQKLKDVFNSKENSIDDLLTDPAVKKFSEYIKKISTLETNWEETLKKAFKEKTIEVKVDLDKSEIYVKNSVATNTDSANTNGTDTATSAEFKKIITLKKEFVDGIKKTIKEVLLSLVEKLFPKNISTLDSSTATNAATITVLKTAIKAFINNEIEKIWKGQWIIKKDDKGEIKIEKVSTSTINTVTVAPAATS